MDYLDYLESEAIHVFREVVAETSHPVFLYSIGKDSSVMLHLALKAFYPSKPPFKFLHVDTTWKFKEMIEFRDNIMKELSLELIVHINKEGLKQNISPFTHGSETHTRIMKTDALKEALNKYNFDAAFGGARRDEEKSRSKERIFSFRTNEHSWDPKNQRPEIWSLYNIRKNKNESFRVFPLSNWTEVDIWQYILKENIKIPSLYFAKKRKVVPREGQLIMVNDERMLLHKNEKVQIENVRFRTLGCYPLTGAIRSNATTIEDIINETLQTKTSEREGRLIDSDVNSSMEDKKKDGYF